MGSVLVLVVAYGKNSHVLLQRPGRWRVLAGQALPSLRHTEAWVLKEFGAAGLHERFVLSPPFALPRLQNDRSHRDMLCFACCFC